MTSDLVPRLAWGVGHRRKSRGGAVLIARGVFSSGKLNVVFKGSFLFHVFQVLLLNFITKLEKNQPDTIVSPPAGCSRGLAVV